MIPVRLERWFLLLAALCTAAALSISEPPHQLSSVRLQNEAGKPLRVLAYHPEGSVASRGAIICQPINNTPGVARPLAMELVKDGFAVLTFDWKGHHPDENRQWVRSSTPELLASDLEAAIAYLRSLPEIDPDGIVLAGHSVGGTLAIRVAFSDPSVTAVASIGMGGDISREKPRNVLFAVGLYDEFRNRSLMLDSLAEASGLVVAENRTVGDHESGTARRLGISPTSDHFTELLDSGIHAEVRDWFHASLGILPPPRSLLQERRVLLETVAWVTLIAAGLLLARRWSRAFSHARRLIPLAALGGAALLTLFKGSHYLVAVDAIIVLVVIGVAGGMLSLLDDESFARTLLRGVRLATVFWASLLITLVVNNAAGYAAHPQYLLSLPTFSLKHLLGGAYAYLRVYPRQFLFSAMGPDILSLQYWTILLLAAEVLFPGWAAVLLNHLGGLFRKGGASPGAGRRKAKTVLLLVLLAVFAGLTTLRLHQGFITAESLAAASRFIARFTVLPILLFAMLWKISRKMGNRRLSD